MTSRSWTSSPFANIEAEYVTRDQLRIIRDAFQKLSENQRRVLELAYFEGLSQTEISAHLQQPLGTVKTWVRTALQALREGFGRVRDTSGVIHLAGLNS